MSKKTLDPCNKWGTFQCFPFGTQKMNTILALKGPIIVGKLLCPILVISIWGIEGEVNFYGKVIGVLYSGFWKIVKKC